MLVRYKPILGALVGMGITVIVFAIAVDLLALLFGAKELLLYLLIALVVLLLGCAIMKCFGKVYDENV